MKPFTDADFQKSDEDWEFFKNWYKSRTGAVNSTLEFWNAHHAFRKGKLIVLRESCFYDEYGQLQDSFLIHARD